MSIRVTALFLVVAFLAVYAFRDWFKSLCGLILIMAVIEHPDMPKTILGIQGLNVWNALLCVVFIAWLTARRREGLVWDLPPYVRFLLLGYLGVVVVGFVRMVMDRDHLGNFTLAGLVSEHLINTVKWVVPGLLLYDGCRTRRRLHLALVCVLGIYFLLAVQVARWMPPSAAMSGDSLEARSRKIILNEVGYHRVNMSMMLCGASWAILATLPLTKRRLHQCGIVAAALIVAYGQALTGGRMGYATWGVVGLILCTVRWRKYLLAAPLVVGAIAVALPGTVERMLQGFGEATASGQTEVDDYEVTAGRTLIWPYVIDEIMEAPSVGHGRLAMVRTGLANRLLTEHNESFPHPHNAYLEMLLDNGVIGFLLVMPFYAVVLYQAARLFLERNDPIQTAVGGVTCALVLALLVAAMGSQTFYPREGSVGMWCAIGILFRVLVERQRIDVMSRALAVHRRANR